MTHADVPLAPHALVAELSLVLQAMRAGLRADMSQASVPTIALITHEAILDPNDRSATLLERLARKVEVGRRLRIAYSDELGAAASDEDVGQDATTYLATLFVYAGITHRDWKFINTAIKLSDGIIEGQRIALPAQAEIVLCHALGEVC